MVIASDSSTPQKMHMCITQRERLRLKMNVCAKMSVHSAFGTNQVYRRKFDHERNDRHPARKYRPVAGLKSQSVYRYTSAAAAITVPTAYPTSAESKSLNPRDPA